MSKPLSDILGNRLINRANETVDPTSLAGVGKLIGLYFSAHWCPPCRGFTPKLVEFYNNFKKSENGDKLEIIFVSSDRDSASFEEYYGEMPWLALPFDERQRKDKLSKKFKIQGIPTFVLMDSTSGRVVTDDGRNVVMDDPNGNNYPWKPKPFSEIIGTNFVNNKKEETSIECMKDKILCIYFSAHWCPPCKAFTPVLIELYKKLKDDHKAMEIIFVSSDRSQESFDQYFSTMPWLAVPYGDTRIEQLSKLFQVSGIPSLVVMDTNGEVITKDGRSSASSDPDGKDFPWRPKAVNNLTGYAAGILNEDACLILFTEGEEQDILAATDIVQPVAEEILKKYKALEDEPPLQFFIGGDDEIVDSVRDFCSMDDKVPLLTILDIPEQFIYIYEAEDITPETVYKFVQDYIAGVLEGTPLRG
ncbi:nucleoredoxin-like [Saccoglossus kowalevskii]|uniref:Nucleoredoxin n=1 Tax=Saccoglossus kowalevskii TaxID=10224 RepID=A0ABM0H113_SACKO|nr:PREDICTED: nucleoredoxin-like [Saccoglossus kowalevskii]